MKKIFIIPLLLLLLSSCTRGYQYFKFNHKLIIVNSTPYEVVVNIISDDDSLLLKEYIVEANSKTSVDSTFFKAQEEHGLQFDHDIGEGIIGGQASPYWNYPSSLLIYDFEGIKISKYQKASFGPRNSECDTLSNFLCNFALVEKTSKPISKREIEFFETVTLYITNHQFLLADSI